MSVGLGPEKKKPVEPYHRLIGVCMWISIFLPIHPYAFTWR